MEQVKRLLALFLVLASLVTNLPAAALAAEIEAPADEIAAAETTTDEASPETEDTPAAPEPAAVDEAVPAADTDTDEPSATEESLDDEAEKGESINSVEEALEAEHFTDTEETAEPGEDTSEPEEVYGEESTPAANEQLPEEPQNPPAAIEMDREQDREMRIGWDNEIHQWYDLFVLYDEESGDWQRRGYEVKNVTSSDPDVVEVRREGDHWRYFAQKHGNAVLTVEYVTEFSEDVQSYTFNVSVQAEIYGVDLWTEGSDQILPGGTITLAAHGWHDSDRYNRRDIDNPEYEWSIQDGEWLVDHSDPDGSQFTLHLLDNAEDGTVFVEVKLYETVDDQRILRASSTIRVQVLNCYTQIEPLELNRRTDVGSEETVHTELRFYQLGQEFTVKEAAFRWYYDPNSLEIRDADGKLVGNNDDQDEYIGSAASSGTSPAFTILRKGDWDTDIDLWADWTDDEGILHSEHRHYHLDRLDYNIWFDWYNGDRLFSDGNLSLGVNLQDIPETAECSFRIVQGFQWKEEDDTASWDREIENACSFDSGKQELTLNGPVVAQASGENPNYTIYVEVANNGQLLARRWEDRQIQQTVLEYEAHDRHWDRDMLPGQDGTIEGFYRGYREDAEHPDGNEFDYEVVDVEVVEGAEHLSDFHPDQNEQNHWWYYRAKDYGTVQLRVTYEDLQGVRHSYDTYLHIKSDVYYMDLHTDGSDIALPGGSISLHANAWHETDNEFNFDAESFVYEWQVDQEDWATITPDPEDQGHAVVQFRDFGEDQHGWFDVRVEVLAYSVIDGERSAEPCCRQEQWLHVSEYYTEVWFRNQETGEYFIGNPGDQLCVGDSITVIPEIRIFDVQNTENQYQVAEEIAAENQYGDFSYRLYFDPNFAEIQYDGNIVEDGETVMGLSPALQITRLQDWDNNIHFDIDWTDEPSGELNRHDNGNLFFDRLNYDVRFDWMHGSQLFNDGDLTLKVFPENLPNGAELNFHVLAGQYRDEDENSISWDAEISNAWSYDQETCELTLHGEAIFQALENEGDVTVFAEVVKNGNTLLLRCEGCFLRMSRVDYDRHWDREMLPGWDGSIDGQYRVHLENAQHPDGEELMYEVLNVEVVEGEAHLSDFRLDQDEQSHWWYYRAKDSGTVQFKVTYRDVNGEEQTYDTYLFIKEDVYELDLWPEDAVETALPGETIYLNAVARHEVNYEFDHSTESFVYEWQIDPETNDANCAERLTPGETDDSVAALKFRDFSEDEYGWYRVRVEVRAYSVIDGVKGGDPCCIQEIWLNVSNEHVEVYPTMVNGQLDIDSSETNTFELRRYDRQYENGYILANNDNQVRYCWYYDEKAVEVRDAQGNKVGNDSLDEQGNPIYNGSEASNQAVTEFTIHRLTNRFTRLELHVWWIDENGEDRHEFRDYRLFDKNYDIYFDAHEIPVYDDWETTVCLNTEQVDHLEYDLQCEVGSWAWEDGQAPEDGHWETMLEAGKDYQFDPDHASVTVYGDQLKAKNLDGANIHITLNYQGEPLSDAWTWVVLQQSCKNHNWSVNTVTEASCEGSGLEHWSCGECGESRDVETPPRHALSKTEAKDATCVDDGNSAYWTCSVCHKLFSDADGQNETTLAATVIAATGNHSWDDGAVTTAATCTDKGVKTFTCTVCETTRTEEIDVDPDNHVGETEFKNAKDASCTEDGYTGDTYCVGCGAKLADGESIAMTGHTLTKTEAKTATCGANGNTAYWTCSVCNKLFSDAEGQNETTLAATVIAATGNHSWDDGAVTTAATCTDKGVKTFTCTVCEATRTEEIDVDPDNHVGETEVRDNKDATYTEEGYTGDTYCVGCGAKLKDGSVIDKLQPVNLSNAVITLSASSYTYDGKAKTPSVTVKAGGKVLKAGTDYNVKYQSNINAGNASVIVTGIDENGYTGTATKKYVIAKASITAKDVVKTYSTKTQYVKIGAKCIKPLTYKSSSKYVTVDKYGKITIKAKFMGKATITITSTDKNVNVKKITVTVNPTATAIASAKNSKSKTMTVTWKKNTTAKGYQIQYSTDKTFKKGVKTVKITKGTTTSTTIKSLSKGKTYYIRIRTVNGSVYSGWSKVKSLKITK